MSNSKKLLSLLACLVLFTGLSQANARTREQAGKDKAEDELLRKYQLVYDVQKNTVSNISFYSSNYGIFGLDVEHNVGGGYWPKGSLNQYIFGGGIWFGGLKYRKADSTWQKLVEVTYNPNSGKSWMVPGRIEDGDGVDNNDVKKYRTYFSTDFRKGDGKPINPADGPNWPLWDDSDKDTLKENRYFGHFILDTKLRAKTTLPKGPAFISSEDIFSTYKDTDLNRYEGGVGQRKNKGYPMRLQFEQTIYSWGFGDYRDFIFIKYDIINRSKDTILDCWMAPVLDIDIARAPQTQAGADNDRVRFYDDNGEDTLNLALQWSNTERGEKGKGFGYLGFDFLESPAVDNNDFVRKDKRFYPNKEQLGLKTFRNWAIAEDIIEDGARYDAMAAGKRDGDNGAGDKRFMMATGKFHMRPDDTVRIVVGIVLANPAVEKDPNGTTEDLKDLIRKDKFMQLVYDNSFKAPEPPERCIITNTWPLNNGVMIHWDSTSEIDSRDKYEQGLDFMGYKIYRARRTNLDTFDVSIREPDNQYPSGSGPLGWKEVKRFDLPTPFYKSVHRSGTDQDNENFPLIDSLRIIGPYMESDGTFDKFKIKVMRVAKGVILFSDDSLMNSRNTEVRTLFKPTKLGAYPVIIGMDTNFISKPWGELYWNILKKDYPNETNLPMLSNPFKYWHDPYSVNPLHNELLDSILVCTVELNRALLSYNPLLWTKTSVVMTKAEFKALPDAPADEVIYLKNTVMPTDDSTKVSLFKMVPLSVDTVMKNTAIIKQALDSVYYYLQNGMAKLKIPTQFEQSDSARNTIVRYMTEMTNNRTFVDIGDDNENHQIEPNESPAKTEKLINNVDYWYKVLAFDEGDYNQPTPIKINDASEGLPNMEVVRPSATAAGNPIKFDITHIDSSLMGGFRNFKMYAIDEQKAQQLFGNHELELEFTPLWNTTFKLQFLPRGEVPFGLYYRRMTVKDVTTGEVLYSNASNFESAPCQGSFREAFTDNAVSYFYSDTIITDPVTNQVNTFGMPWDTSSIVRSGHFTTGDWVNAGYCYSYGATQKMNGVLGFDFDFTVQQRGGKYRPDTSTFSTYKVNTQAITPLNVITDDRVQSNMVVGRNIYGYTFNSGGYPWLGIYSGESYGSFNNGPGYYQVTFKEGGEDTLNLTFGSPARKNTFIVKYLTTEITNTYSIPSPEEAGTGKAISYPSLMAPIVLGEKDTINGDYITWPLSLFPHTDDFIGKYNLSAYAWVNGRGDNNGLKLNAQSAFPSDGPLKDKKGAWVGDQNRYYLSAMSIDGKDQLDLVHMLQIGGVAYAFDYANKGKLTSVDPLSDSWSLLAKPTGEYPYGGPDFKEGDQILLKTTGGAFGLPLPGAKVRFRIVDGRPESADQYEDKQLDQIKVVPNPYYISHQGQKSPYDTKLYITRLPKKCNIDIYTINGDLVRSLVHDEVTNYDDAQEAVEVWDLLSKNNQRIQSQTLVAVITTPNGAKTIKQFTVVVGGFRIIEDQ